MAQKIGRYGYLGMAALFAAGIMTQVYFVGLSLLGGRPSWNDHIGLGHGLGFLALLLVILAYVGRQPRGTKNLTWATFAVYVLLADVVIFLRGTRGAVAALHPVLAITLFALVVTLLVRAWRSVKEESPAATRTDMIQESGV